MTSATGPGARAQLRPTARSIFALLAGFCLVLVLSIVAYAVLYAAAGSSFDAHDNPAGTGVLVALVALTTLFAFGGGALSARLARRAVLSHALLLAVMTGASMASWANEIGAAAPISFRVTLIALPALAILAGAWKAAGA